MKKISILLVVICFTFSSIAQISPAVAANMRFAFEEISDAFTKHTGYTVKPIYGSSGKLVTQIRNGAPFDLFISADLSFADSICASNLNVTKPRIYAYGKLVLWTMNSYDLPNGISILKDSSIKTIAIGDLKLTVYGIATKNFLEKEQLWAKIEPKTVYGDNIAKVAQFILSGSADIGFVAKSMVLSANMNGKGTWVDIDSTRYDPIPQAAVVLKYGERNHREITHALYNFLYSMEAQNILINYGYKIP